MPRNKYCTWWEHYEGFEAVDYYTMCTGSPNKLVGIEKDIARAIWAGGYEYCPFCGKDIDYCQEDEVDAQAEEEHEYRRGVALGLYGYGGD